MNPNLIWTKQAPGVSKCTTKDGALVGTIEFNYTYGTWDAYAGGKALGKTTTETQAKMAVEFRALRKGLCRSPYCECDKDMCIEGRVDTRHMDDKEYQLLRAQSDGS